MNTRDLTGDFNALKGKMRPVDGYDKSYLSQMCEVPVLSVLSNACIDANRQIYVCSEGCDIRSVSDGIVKKVTAVSGLGTTVMIQSGDYLAVYSRLDHTTVIEGDWIRAKERIGNIRKSASFVFMIYEKVSRLDPSEWIAH